MVQLALSVKFLVACWRSEFLYVYLLSAKTRAFNHSNNDTTAAAAVTTTTTTTTAATSRIERRKSKSFTISSLAQRAVSNTNAVVARAQ